MWSAVPLGEGCGGCVSGIGHAQVGFVNRAVGKGGLLNDAQVGRVFFRLVDRFAFVVAGEKTEVFAEVLICFLFTLSRTVLIPRRP